MKYAGAFSQNHLHLGIKTYLNATLTGNIVIDTSGRDECAEHAPHLRENTSRPPRLVFRTGDQIALCRIGGLYEIMLCLRELNRDQSLRKPLDGSDAGATTGFQE